MCLSAGERFIINAAFLTEEGACMADQGRKCIGLIEAIGLAAAISAADAAVKAANVELIGYEYAGYSARIAVKVEGKAEAVRTAVAAGRAAAYGVKGTLKGCQSTAISYALDPRVYNTLIHNRMTTGDPLQIASGKRPQGTGKTGKRAGVWDGRGVYIYE